MHHGLVADGDDLDDVGVLLGQRNSAVDFGPVAFEVLFGVVGRTRPGAGTVDPGAEHDVHLKAGFLLLQFADGPDHIAGVRQLDVVGPQEPDAHRVQDAHVVLELGQCRLVGAAQGPVAAVGDGGIVGVAQQFGRRCVVHGVMLV